MQTQGNWRTDQRRQINKNRWLVQQKMNRFSQGLGQLSKFSQENWQTYWEGNHYRWSAFQFLQPFALENFIWSQRILVKMWRPRQGATGSEDYGGVFHTGGAQGINSCLELVETWSPRLPKLRFRVVVSSGDIIGRSWGHHGICNLQDLGVQSQDPIYHPTCSNFEWGETNINQIYQCLRVPQWLEKHLVSGGIHDGSRSLMIRSHHFAHETPISLYTGLASALIEGPRIARWYSLRQYWLIKVAVSVNGEYRNIADLCWFSAKRALNHGKLMEIGVPNSPNLGNTPFLGIFGPDVGEGSTGSTITPHLRGDIRRAPTGCVEEGHCFPESLLKRLARSRRYHLGGNSEPCHCQVRHGW